MELARGRSAGSSSPRVMAGDHRGGLPGGQRRGAGAQAGPSRHALADRGSRSSRRSRGSSCTTTPTSSRRRRGRPSCATLDVMKPPRPFDLSLPLRILAVISAPSDAVTLNAAPGAREPREGPGPARRVGLCRDRLARGRDAAGPEPKGSGRATTTSSTSSATAASTAPTRKAPSLFEDENGLGRHRRGRSPRDDRPRPRVAPAGGSQLVRGRPRLDRAIRSQASPPA